MNPEDADQWQQEAFDEVFRALAASADLRGVLVFKGARVLALRLRAAGRRSLDIDSNLTTQFIAERPKREEQRAVLETRFRRAIVRYFERQAVVRFQLKRLTVSLQPREGSHPLGWNAFIVKVALIDASRSHVVGLPTLQIDVAAPEDLTDLSVSLLEVQGSGGGAPTQVPAYTLERLAGEKLRAFLSTLPAYRVKVRKPGDAIRVKDLHDLACIRRVEPVGVAPGEFWRRAADEFRLACTSRYIDCAGPETFRENWPATKLAYETDTNLARNVPFAEAERTLDEVTAFFGALGVFPLRFPLPASTVRDE